MNGYEFLEEFQKLNMDVSKTDVIILTSSTSGRDLEKIQQFPIRYYVSKPLLDQNLMKIINMVQSQKKHKFVMLGS